MAMGALGAPGDGSQDSPGDEAVAPAADHGGAAEGPAKSGKLRVGHHADPRAGPTAGSVARQARHYDSSRATKAFGPSA